MAFWQPTASLQTLRQRAEMLTALRAFFAERNVLEVDVPVLARAAVTDPNLESFMVHFPSNKDEIRFLMTSPEFYLKRLLAAGSGAVYSVGHAFRAEENSARHQPEFVMLEWYRPEWILSSLREEVEALVTLFIDYPVRHTSYRQLFMDAFSLDPHVVSLGELKKISHEKLSPAFDSDDRGVWLDLLFSHLIEPQLHGLVFVEHFPVAQAALAKTLEDAWGNTVADRFELYINGVEIANAYQEETNAAVLEQRFARDLATRKQRGQYLPEIDSVFLAAMREGLPECAGVALGFDRLVMVALGCQNIADASTFSD